jgi:hypothetical protein
MIEKWLEKGRKSFLVESFVIRKVEGLSLKLFHLKRMLLTRTLQYVMTGTPQQINLVLQSWLILLLSSEKDYNLVIPTTQRILLLLAQQKDVEMYFMEKLISINYNRCIKKGAIVDQKLIQHGN